MNISYESRKDQVLDALSYLRIYDHRPYCARIKADNEFAEIVQIVETSDGSDASGIAGRVKAFFRDSAIILPLFGDFRKNLKFEGDLKAVKDMIMGLQK